MTNEEAKEELKALSEVLSTAKQDGFKNPFFGVPNYKLSLGFTTKIFDVLAHAIKALEKQERYRWHDLRKNPDDLPIPEKEVDVVCERKYAGKSVYTYTHALYEDGTIR